MLDYAVGRGVEYLKPFAPLRGTILLALAVKFGATRLIDNRIVRMLKRHIPRAYRSGICQSIGAWPISSNARFADEKGLLPKNFAADNGDGCAAVRMQLRLASINFSFFCAYAPHSMNTTGSGRDDSARNRSVRERLPAFVLVRIRLVRPHRQNGVEQHHSLFRPGNEAAVVGNLAAEVVVQFLEHIHQRRRRFDAGPHRKAKTVRLPFTVIGVLAEQQDFHFVVGGVLECVVYVGFRRIDRMGSCARRRRMLAGAGSTAW